MAEGIIMKALSGFYYVDDGNDIITCRGRGKLRRDKVTPLVGDRVRFTPTENGAGALEEILPRRNEFYRPAVANIDQLVIIASQANPVTDPFLIDRLSVIAEEAGCRVTDIDGRPLRFDGPSSVAVASEGVARESYLEGTEEILAGLRGRGL
jgi:putative ribosome biogenesis GTPase RsgA